MTSVRQLCILPQNYWKNQYAVIIMSHTKAGYPIIQSLLNIGMFVVAVSPQFKKNEMLKHHLSRKHSKRFLTKQVDLNTLTSINMLMLELKLEVQTVQLFVCLIPQLSNEEKCFIFEPPSAALLQTILEVSELGVGAVCAAAARKITSKNSSHIWVMRYHHQDSDVLHDYFEYLMNLGHSGPRLLNVNLFRKNKTCTCAKCDQCPKCS